MEKRLILYFSFVICLNLGMPSGIAQSLPQDSSSLDYAKIFAYCLDANLPPVLQLLEQHQGKWSAKDLKLKKAFEQRFKYQKDRSNYLQEHHSDIDPLLEVFRDYWRMSLQEPQKDFSSLLENNLISFLRKHHPPTQGRRVDKDSVDSYVLDYLARKGYHTTKGIGKTGKLYDLLVWKTQKDTTYTFSLKGENIHARVVFLDDFITLGWEEYASFGLSYPGGWSTKDALYCVRKAYDLQSENFLVKYLAHEGRHFSDLNAFPKLSSTDLEYRAKLTELSLAEKELYNLISFFIKNANYDSQNAHSVANYCVIRDLSKLLFGSAFEEDISKWKTLEKEKLNTTAFTVLQQNTRALQQLGPGVERYIKQ